MYTLPVCSVLAVLAAALALASGGALGSLSGALPGAIPGQIGGPIFVPSAALLAALLSVAFAVLSGVLSLAMNGSMRIVSTLDLDATLRAIGQWLASLAAGPALMLAAAVSYFFECGDPAVVDRLILIELIAFASGSFLVNLLVTCPRGGFRRLNPVALLEVASLLGWRLFAGSIAAAVSLFAFGWFGELLLERLHVAGVEGLLWLGLWWFSALALAAFSFRRLGLWYHCADQLRRSSASGPATQKQRGSRIALAKAAI
jgi:hypothetical protein